MDLTDLNLLFDYNTWATRRILDAAADLDDLQFSLPSSFPHGGLRGTLVHLVSAEWIWRSRLQEGASPTAMLSEDDLPTLPALRNRWEAEQDSWRAWLETLTDDDLGRSITYTRTGGQRHTNVLWHLLVHLVNHGTQHRSEAAALLTGYGRSPGDMDWIIYLREKE
jgi:uncharacterized damage-inducible protein DinB